MVGVRSADLRWFMKKGIAAYLIDGKDLCQATAKVVQHRDQKIGTWLHALLYSTVLACTGVVQPYRIANGNGPHCGAVEQALSRYMGIQLAADNIIQSLPRYRP